MALMKCAECGKEVSDKASSCPNCGNPVHTSANTVGMAVMQPNTRSVQELRGSLRKTEKMFFVALFVIAILSFLSVKYLFPLFLYGNENIELPDIRSRMVPATNGTNSGASKVYEVQRNDLWGHAFYTSKIDSSGNIDIGSAAKQKIARLLAAIGFPQRLSQELVVVEVDPTLVKPGDQLEIPWQPEQRARLDLQPMIGTYQGLGSGAVIALNNLTGTSDETLMHELGHVIGSQLTADEWTQYYKLRNIPASTPRTTENPALSPEEDFAEVYKAMYQPGGATVRTQYGLLVPSGVFGGGFGSPCYEIEQQIIRDYIRAHLDPMEMMADSAMMDSAENSATANPRVQKCRRENNGPGALGIGVMYVSRVDGPTEQFVKGIVERLR